MNNIVENIKKSPLVLIIWHLIGKPIPPPHIYKQMVVSKSRYRKSGNIDILYESGTFKGDMVYGMKNRFQKIISIELSNFYFQHSKERFKKNKHINIIKGDSKNEIKKFLKSLKEPAVFWLDGHNSFGDTAKSKLNTPILDELKSILNHKNKSHVILIDDAREFNGKNDYPKINELKRMLNGSNYSLQVKDDIIRITPRNF